MNEELFISQLDKTYFKDVRKHIDYYVKSSLAHILSKGNVSQFIQLLREKGVISSICTTDNIDIPSTLDKRVVERLIKSRCNEIREYLLDSICSYLSLKDAIELRKYSEKRDILSM